MKDNKVIVDLTKCQWAKFFYRNQYGNISDLQPSYHSNRGIIFDPDDLKYSVAGEKITMLQFATKNNLLDMWQPCVKLKLTASETLLYSGDKAVSIYKEWCSRIFNKKGKK